MICRAVRPRPCCRCWTACARRPASCSVTWTGWPWRSALATSRGLALATGKPLIGITTTAAVAAAVTTAERRDAILLVALDSKRTEAYVQAFDAGGHPLDEVAALAPEAYAADVGSRWPEARFVVAGDAAPTLIAALRRLGARAVPDAARHPDAATIAMLAAQAPLPAGLPGPIYLHPAAVTPPRVRTVL
jgi:tRNA threonylcarbamoyladenosine biosynthesis protein TsaB